MNAASTKIGVRAMTAGGSTIPPTVVRKEEVELREEVGEIGENLHLDIQSGCDPPVVGASLSVL